MSAYKTFNTRNTPQSEPVPGKAQVENSAGGYVFQIDDWARLQRFLILGSDSATYYASAEKLTKDNAGVIVQLLKADGRRVVDTIVEVSVSGRAPKNDPAIFALAMAAGLGNKETRAYALDNLHRVCRIGTHLFMFADFVEQFRGWGRGLKRAVGNWYNEKDPDKLAYQVVKYQQRGGWSNYDLLKLAHPNPTSELHNQVYKWVAGKEVTLSEVPGVITGYEWAKSADSAKTIVNLVQDYRLTREMIPTQWLNEPEVWDALLQDMPMTAMIRNLGKMSQVGLLKPMSAASQLVVSRLNDRERLQKARIHPVNVLIAMRTYTGGHGMRGSLQWDVVPQVIDALDDAFYAAFDYVEPTGKRFLLGLDVSGSMTVGVRSASNLTARELSAAMAMTTIKTEQSYQVVGFTGGNRGFYDRSAVTPLGLSSRQRLDDVVRKVSNLPFGRTDCALPMLYAKEKNLAVDVFIIYTDNETWVGNVHPFQALQDYRQTTGIPAKLIVAAFTSTGFSIADPNDPGMLDIVGMDSAVPTLIRDFSAS